MSDVSIMTVGEMIEIAFGDPEFTRIDFKLIETILYLIARQLRVLNRKIIVQSGIAGSPTLTETSSTIVVSEVKLKAMKTRKKTRDDRVATSAGGHHTGYAKYKRYSEDRRSKDGGGHDKSKQYRSKHGKSQDDEENEKPVKYHYKHGVARDDEEQDDSKKYRSKHGKAKDDEGYDRTKHTRKGDGRSKDDKYHDSMSKQHHTADGKSKEYGSFDKSKHYRAEGGKSKDDEEHDKSEFLSTGDEQSKHGHGHDTSKHFLATHGKDQKISVVAPTDSKGKTKQKPSKLSTIESQAESENDSLNDADLADKLNDQSSEEFEEDTEAKKQAKPTHATKHTSQKYYKMLDKIEEQREHVLRVIRQRANSQEEAAPSPSPMASMESTEIEFEKLLVVQRVSEGEVATRSHTDVKRSLSIVTQDQFNELLERVLRLQQQFNAYNFPAHNQMMEQLRKGVNLSDSLAALQISGRLDVTEKAIGNLTSILSELTHRDLSRPESAGIKKGQVMVKKSDKSGQPETLKYPSMLPSESAMIEPPIALTRSTATDEQDDASYVTKKELLHHLAELNCDVHETMTTMLNKPNAGIEKAVQQALALEKRFGDFNQLSNRVHLLEQSVHHYSEQINALDVGLSSQLTNVFEQLARLQYDLETGLENFADNIVHQGIDPEVVTSFNSNFQNLHNDVERHTHLQKELSELVERLAMDFQFLKREQEMLRDSKCDREEFADALRDKVGIEQLNKMVTEDQSLAMYDGFKDHIKKAYKKAFSYEQEWQKSLDDLSLQLCSKVDIVHFGKLRDDINKRLNGLKKRIDQIDDVVGEPLSAVVTKSIYRDTVCISCCNPAHPAPLDSKLPALPKARGKGGDVTKPKVDIEAQPCIPGVKIVHRIDPRAEMCTRYCGGAYTKQKIEPKLKQHIDVKRLRSPRIADDSENEKISKLDKRVALEPCVPCNITTMYRTLSVGVSERSSSYFVPLAQEFRAPIESCYSIELPQLNPAEYALPIEVEQIN